jgi:hypothetical protein
VRLFLRLLLVCVGLGVVVSIGCPHAAGAEETSSGLFISSGAAAGTFSGVLTGSHLTLLADEAHGGTAFSGFTVTDGRDSGGGWSVTVSASRFTNSTFEGRDMAPDSLTMPRLAVQSADASCTAPPGDLRQAATVDTGGEGVVMASCTAAGQGMGTYIFSYADDRPWELAVPADTYAGVYTSVVTITVAPLAL